MSRDVHLGGLLLDARSPAERTAALAEDPGLAAELAGLQAVFHGLADLAPRVSAPAGLRARLMATASAPVPYAAHQAAIAELLDLDVQGARSVLRAAESQGGWRDWFAGVRMKPLRGGPATRGLQTVLLRGQPGVVFPEHSHQGEERVYLLAGACVDSRGPTFVEGDLIINSPESSHSFEVTSDEDMVFVVRVAGVRFLAAP